MLIEDKEAIYLRVWIGDRRLLICQIKVNCHHFKVPTTVFLKDKEYNVVGVHSLDYLPGDEIEELDYFEEGVVDEISFEESSEIEEVPISFIHKCQSNFFLPPKIKRVFNDVFWDEKPPAIHLPGPNRYFSIFEKRNIVNHFPLELLPQFTHKSRPHIRETVRIISSNAFYKNKFITSIAIPPSVECLGDKSFSECSSLHSVTIKGKSKLRSIGSHAFERTSLKKFVFQSNVESIGRYAFNECEKLASITFINTSRIKAFSNQVFSRTAIAEIVVPRSVEIIDSYAFEGCKKLTIVLFQDDSMLKIIGDRAFSGTSIKSIEIPSSVEDIGRWAFNTCNNLTNVTFAKNSCLKTIGDHAFDSKSQTDIVFPIPVNIMEFFGCY